MQPLERLREVATPGGPLTLLRRGRDFTIQLDREDLMISRLHGSEQELASRSLAEVRTNGRRRVLIGGLGMGYTLRAALDAVDERSEVVVSEIFAAVVEWNRELLGPLAGSPLDDPRASVRIEDVRESLRGKGEWDAVLLDVDNGPNAFTLASNETLYGRAALERIVGSLRPGGVLGVWSAHRDPAFVRRMTRAGLEARAEKVSGRHGGKGPRHTLFLGRRRS